MRNMAKSIALAALCGLFGIPTLHAAEPVEPREVSRTTLVASFPDTDALIQSAIDAVLNRGSFSITAGDQALFHQSAPGVVLHRVAMMNSGVLTGAWQLGAGGQLVLNGTSGVMPSSGGLSTGASISVAGHSHGGRPVGLLAVVATLGGGQVEGWRGIISMADSFEHLARHVHLRHGEHQRNYFGHFEHGGDGHWSNRGHGSLDYCVITPAVPEPDTYVLIGIGLLALWLARRRRKPRSKESS